MNNPATPLHRRGLHLPAPPEAFRPVVVRGALWRRHSVRHRWIWLLMAACCLVGWSASPVTAQSLWRQRVQGYTSPIKTPRASRPGDLLNVLVVESTDINNRDQRLLNKINQSNIETGGSFGFSGAVGSAGGGLESEESTDAARLQNSNTQYRIQRGFSDQFQVMVQDVMPNGNLLILGQREVKLDGDVRKLLLTGEVRPVDVSANNSVLSQQIYNLKLDFQTEGSESHYLNQGWLGKKFNKWWPF